jgi:hypothetical protein
VHIIVSNPPPPPTSPPSPSTIPQCSHPLPPSLISLAPPPPLYVFPFPFSFIFLSFLSLTFPPLLPTCPCLHYLYFKILSVPSSVSVFIFHSACLSSAFPLPHPWPFFGFMQLHEYLSPEKTFIVRANATVCRVTYNIFWGLVSRSMTLFLLFTYIYTHNHSIQWSISSFELHYRFPHRYPLRSGPWVLS